jgi:uncharacterized membrane protein (UPF0127 family)
MGKLVELYKPNSNKDELIAKGQLASTPFERMRGLIGKKEIAENYILLFKNASSIHTFFMSFPIDVIFTDKDFKIIAIFKNIGNGKIINCFRSKYTIEARANFSDKMKLKVGDKLSIKFIDSDNNIGQVTIEYALIIAVLIVGIIVLWPAFADTVKAYIASIINFLNDI